MNTEIKAALAQLGPLPTPVADWLVETGTDSADEPAIWVWAVLQNEKVALDTRLQLRDMILDFLREKSDTSIYVNFRTASEMDG
ncbi:MAG: hypothetical protein ERJ69_01835 [Aphanocapsa feldmannii 288cV]|nr:MAG: hypothetical protein ERJ69_01835 [Aphanocapsa feldmannii 288cV]